MKPKTAQLDWRAGRRRRAWELKAQGWQQQASAAALGVTGGAVSQGRTRAREYGVEALRRHPAPGREAKLTGEQIAQLPSLLARGPAAYGVRGPVWTGKRVAEVIRRTFGVVDHPAPVRRRLHAVRHSVQPPRTRAAPRDEGAIAAWWRARAGPRKKAADEGRTVVWVDHSGCSWLPLAVRTGAPCGQTPLRRVPLTHASRAASSGIPPTGACACSPTTTPPARPLLCASCAYGCARSGTRCASAGLARPATVGNHSQTAYAKVRPSAGIWSSCRATPPT
ncbi:MAG TPA: winged helix-turn-helix domain-containing protein [Ktedonobacterales bacterium]|nr:winged helix-turn-helix domain-containing protein [Ktedonobacterales bacterium]